MEKPGTETTEYAADLAAIVPPLSESLDERIERR